MTVRPGITQGWLIAGVVAAGVVALVVALFRAPDARPIEPSNATPQSVTLAPDTDALLSEEAAMRDPTPLFLPTEFNASGSAWSPETRRELLSSFGGYEPKLRYREANVSLGMPPAVQVPQKAADAFGTDRPVRPFLGLGRSNDRAAPLATRSAFVEVAAAGDGQLIIAQPIADARPPADAAWQPLVFLLAVDASGVVGPPVLTESSRVAAVDSYFEGYVIRVLRIGERLGPGLYRVGIGP